MQRADIEGCVCWCIYSCTLSGFIHFLKLLFRLVFSSLTTKDFGYITGWIREWSTSNFMTERFILHPTICPSGMWVVTVTLAGTERQSFSPADGHWCLGCSLPALQPQHSTALQAGRHSWQRGWQLQELTSSSPAEVDSVSPSSCLLNF